MGWDGVESGEVIMGAGAGISIDYWDYIAFLLKASMSIIPSRKRGAVEWFKMARTEGRD